MEFMSGRGCIVVRFEKKEAYRGSAVPSSCKKRKEEEQGIQRDRQSMIRKALDVRASKMME